MITGASITGLAYILTSVPQIPATSIFSSAPSSGITGIGNSRSSVLLGPVLTAASTRSAIRASLTEVSRSGRYRLGRVMPELRLKTVTRTQGNNAALKDGTVNPDGLAI